MLHGNEQRAMTYRREIDGLRAVSVVAVILFHAGFEFVKGGFVGVDVFFVISGYLITSIILRGHASGTFSLLQFYERRARRILPALFLVLACCLPFAWYWMLPLERWEFSLSLVAVSTFLSNILFAETTGYFGQAMDKLPLLHTWSLAVEEQFYLLFPLAIRVLWPLGRRRAALAIALVAIASLLLAEYGWRNFPTGNFFLAPTRIWEILAGSLCAFWHFEREQHRNGLLAGVGLALILFSVFYFDRNTPFPSVYATLPVGGTALVLLYATKETLVCRLLSMKPLVGVGLISYSAYLWHQPLFAFVRIRTNQHPSLLVMVSLSCASLALAAVSWRFVERPCRKRPTRETTRGLKIGAAVSVLFIGIGFWGHQTEGLAPEQLNERQMQLLATSTQDAKSLACHIVGEDYPKPSEACEFFGSNIQWAVLGDSHAIELSGALARILRPNDIGVKQLTFRDCPPSFGRTNKWCSAWTNDVVDYLVRDPSKEIVVVSYRLNYALFGDHDGVFPGIPDTVGASERERRWDALIGLLQALRQANKTVVFVLQVPELPFQITKIILDNPKETDQLIGVDRAWWKKRSAFVRSRLRDIPEDVVTIDPAPIFCDETHCYGGRGETSHYYDDDHPSEAGANLVAKEIIKRLGL